MRRKLEADMAEMEEERDRFEKERRTWEATNNVTMEDLRRKSLESISREWVVSLEQAIWLFVYCVTMRRYR